VDEEVNRDKNGEADRMNLEVDKLLICILSGTEDFFSIAPTTIQSVCAPSIPSYVSRSNGWRFGLVV